MVKWLNCLVYILAISFAGCSRVDQNKGIPSDPHSFSQPNKVMASHLRWVGTVDFEQKQISAKASWLLTYASEADTVVFDTYGLLIDSVQLDDNQTTYWKLDTPQPFLGSALRIALKTGSQIVHIFYRTSSQAKGLQWLEAEQTADKQHPFLFSQGQAILTRSWLPCQDSPALRFSFDAELSVPPGLKAVMSASNQAQMQPSGRYSFSNKKPIPSYLFALAVGDIHFKAFDNRTGVFAEKSQLEQAWQEFANLPPMIRAAERLYGRMPWERLDLLVLPPSFPFGGMENPMLMYVAPSLLAGDRSLTNLVAHELAHAWSDQMLRHASWEDFWLNEFFTNYIERRIIEEMEGPTYAEMMQALSNLELERNLAQAKTNNQPTILAPKLLAKDPDLVLSAATYQKCTAFMMQLESKLGKKELDQWIKKQIAEGTNPIYTTTSFIKQHQNSLFPPSIFDSDILEAWLYQNELPRNYERKPSARFASVEAVATIWQQGEDISHLPTGGWSAYEWIYFLKSINQGQIKHERLQELDALIALSQSGNVELKSNWFQLCLQHNYLEVLPEIEILLAHIGRRKILLTIYKALWNNPLTKDKALHWFETYQQRYHPVARNSIAQLLGK